jgi:hypothetical protein
MERTAPPLTDITEPPKTAQECAAYADKVMREAGLRK